MKVIQIVDTPYSAIANQANAIKKYNQDIIDPYNPIAIHPKKPGNIAEQLKKQICSADIICCQYWKSGIAAKNILPKEWKNKKKILTHHNPYNLHEENWEEYDRVVTMNGHQKSQLPNSVLIPHTIDLKYFVPNKNEHTDEKVVQMCVARIEDTKGVLQIAQACNDLKFKFILVGRVSKADYAKEVIKIGGKYLEFKQNATDEEMRKSYYQSTIHVCNSKPNFESGTLPILEAMACGTPVLTQNIGHVPDHYDPSKPHLKIMECSYKDVEGIKNELKNLMENREKRLELINNAYEFIKTRDHKVKADLYRKLYEDVLK
jgi:glycosyltransferase involved in cell wall biosynthesis